MLKCGNEYVFYYIFTIVNLKKVSGQKILFEKQLNSQPEETLPKESIFYINKTILRAMPAKKNLVYTYLGMYVGMYFI